MNDHLVIVTLWNGWFVDRFRREGMGVFLKFKEYKEVHSFVPNELAWPSITRWFLRGQRPPTVTPEEDAYFSLDRVLDFAEWFANMGKVDIQQVCSWVTDEDYSAFRTRAIHLLETTEAGRNHTKDAAQMKEDGEISQLLIAGDLTRLYPMILKRAQVNTERDLQDLDVHALLSNAADGFLWGSAYRLMHLKEWSWSWMESVDVLALLQSYDFDHADHMRQIGWHLAHVAFLPALRGDIGSANACFDIVLDILRRMMANLDGPNATVFKINVFDAVCNNALPSSLVLLGRSDDAAAFMSEFGTTWSTADARVDEHEPLEGAMRKRGSTERVWVQNCSAEEYAWKIKLQYVQCTTWREVPTADVVAALPSPDLLETYVTTVGTTRWRTEHTTCSTLQLQAAAACMKLERHADALLYLDKALRIDPDDPTTDRRAIVQAEGRVLRGRVLAAQGKKVEAEAAFEEAAEVSHRTGARLWEMFALRDLITCVLDEDGRRDEGLKRLKAVLSEMKGLPEELSNVLGGGLDAGEILRM